MAEVHQNGTTKSSNSAVEAGTQNLPLSDDKDTKKQTAEAYIKRKEQEPPVPTVVLPYATDKAEVRNDETIKGSDSAHAAGTLNLPLFTDKDTRKRSCRIRFPEHLYEAGIRKYKEMRTTTRRLSVHGVPRKVS